jgi:hypothetical protein
MNEAVDKPERSGHPRALAGTPTRASTDVNAGALAHILVDGLGQELSTARADQISEGSRRVGDRHRRQTWVPEAR